jgi:hypothetical protein
MLGGTSPSIGRDQLDEDLVKLLGKIGYIRIATLSQCNNSVVFSEDAVFPIYECFISSMFFFFFIYIFYLFF